MCQPDCSPPLGVPALANLPCNRSDGHLECGFYIQIAGIQQDRVAGGAHWCRIAPSVAFVAAADVGQDMSELDRLAPAHQLQVPPPGSNLRGGGDIKLNGGLRTHHRADIAAVEDGARSAPGEGAL